MRKIIFLDVDGTLTNDDKVITPKTLQALVDIQKKGHIVALASGRPTPGMAFLADQLQLDAYEGYVLSFNGGKIVNWKTKEVLKENTLSNKFLPKLVSYANNNGIGLITYDEEGVIAGTRIDKYIETEARINKIPYKRVDLVDYVDYNLNKCLLTAPDEIAAIHERQLAGLFKDELNVFRSAPFFIEVVPKGIDKAASILWLAEYLSIPVQDTIACGDGFNDLSMVKAAGVGVAMENGQDIVKESADYITGSNNADGLVEVIERFIMGNR